MASFLNNYRRNKTKASVVASGSRPSLATGKISWDQKRKMIAPTIILLLFTVPPEFGPYAVGQTMAKDRGRPKLLNGSAHARASAPNTPGAKAFFYTVEKLMALPVLEPNSVEALIIGGHFSKDSQSSNEYFTFWKCDLPKESKGPFSQLELRCSNNVKGASHGELLVATIGKNLHLDRQQLTTRYGEPDDISGPPSPPPFVRGQAGITPGKDSVWKRLYFGYTKSWGLVNFGVQDDGHVSYVVIDRINGTSKSRSPINSKGKKPPSRPKIPTQALSTG